MGLLNTVSNWIGKFKGLFRAPETQLDHIADLVVEKIRSASTGGQITFLPYLDEKTEETEEHRAAYPVMLRDPMIKSALLSKILAVTSLSVQYHPPDNKDENAKEQARFVQHYFERLKGGPPRTGRNIALPALMNGWSLTHKKFRFEDKGEWKGKWVWDAWKSKSTKGLRIAVDDYSNVIGIQSNRYDGGKVWPPDDFIIHSYMDMYEDPRGMSDLRAAFAPYWRKTMIWNLRGLHLEKFTSPFLRGTYPAGSNDVKVALEAALERAKSSTWMAIPTGAMVDAIEMSMRGTADFESAIQDCDREILVGIFGSYLSILEGKTTGARAMGEVHRENSELFQWALAMDLSYTYTEAAREICELNFPVPAPPRMTLEGVSEADLLVRSQVDEALQRMGKKLSNKEASRVYARAEPEDEEDVLVSTLAAAPPMPGMGDPFGGDEIAPKYIDEAIKGLGLGGQPPADPLAATQDTAATGEPTDAANALRATVGGSQQIAALQKMYYARELPRDAVMANAKLIFGLSETDSALLFPELPPDAPVVAEPTVTVQGA